MFLYTLFLLQLNAPIDSISVVGYSNDKQLRFRVEVPKIVHLPAKQISVNVSLENLASHRRLGYLEFGIWSFEVLSKPKISQILDKGVVDFPGGPNGLSVRYLERGSKYVSSVDLLERYDFANLRGGKYELRFTYSDKGLFPGRTINVPHNGLIKTAPITLSRDSKRLYFEHKRQDLPPMSFIPNQDNVQINAKFRRLGLSWRGGLACR